MRFVAFLLGLAFVLTACGSTGDEPSPSDSTAGDSLAVDTGHADTTHDTAHDVARDSDATPGDDTAAESGDAFDAAEASDAGVDGTDAIADVADAVPGDGFAPDVWTDAGTFVGAPVALSSIESAPHAIVVDSTDVYWTNSGDGTVVTCKTDGTARTPLVTGRTTPWALALDATTVYFSDLGTSDIRMAPRTGGADTQFTFAGEVVAIVVDATSVFYTVHNDQSVDRKRKGATITLGYDFSGAHPMALALDGTSAFWTNDDVGAYGVVTSLPIATFGSGSPSTPLVSDLSHPAGIAADVDALYVTSTGDGRVLKIGKDASAPTSVTLSGIETSPTGVTVDADGVYVTDYDAGTIVAFDKSTGARRVLAKDQTNPDGITVTTEALYWVNRGDGRVMKLAR